MNVYKIRIQLRATEPPIWRTLEIQTHATLGALHFAIQHAMGWSGEEPFFFVLESDTYGFPSNDYSSPELPDMKDAGALTLEEVFATRDSLSYVYDPEADWIHDLKLVGTEAMGLGTKYPRIAEGERNTPPERVSKKHYTITMRDVAESGLYPNDEQWENWDPDDFDDDPFIPTLEVLEAMVTKTDQPHVHFTGNGDEFQNEGVRSSNRVSEGRKPDAVKEGFKQRDTL